MLESLDESCERQTGKELYEDLLRWKEFEHNGELKAELIQINTRIEFFKALKSVKTECISKGIIPILHLEIHGNKFGLTITSGELISWDDFYIDLVDINKIIANNLFLTLGVCNGAYLMSQIKLTKPAPFYGFIGSFDKLYAQDIIIRYNEFYTEFLTSFDFHKAIKKLFEVNSGVPADYRFISSEETFNKVYHNYSKEMFTDTAIQKRIDNLIRKENISFKTRMDRRQFRRHFKKKLLETKQEYKIKHMITFFMTDLFPENIDRFGLDEIKRKNS